MDCIKYRKIISAYIDGETSNLETEEMLKHISECKGCSVIFKNNTLLSEYIADSYSNSLTKIDLSESIMSKIENEAKPEDANKRNNLFLFKGIAVAAVVALFLTGIYFNRNVQVASEKHQDKITESLVMEHINKSENIVVPKKKLPQPTFVNYSR